jgi:hypothetical protein
MKKKITIALLGGVLDKRVMVDRGRKSFYCFIFLFSDMTFSEKIFGKRPMTSVLKS